MERFAFKIDAALKANLYKICRLCGIDNPAKVPILLENESSIVDLDEPVLSQKVYELVGFMVSKNDKMPQTMCSICVDKINDFYEFREMCYATNNQTRKLLGLKAVEPQKLCDVKPIVSLKTEPLPCSATGKRGRKRKTEELINNSASGSNLNPIKKEPTAKMNKKQRLLQSLAGRNEIKDEPPDNVATGAETSKLGGKKGRKFACTVCAVKFDSRELADEHRSEVHVPSIPRYICNACDQTHRNPNDIKAHLLWHKLSKTPYQCPACGESVANNYAFSRHMRGHSIRTPVQLQVFDRECPLCKKTFVTNFFYNTHPCAIRTRKCGGCNRSLASDATYLRHAPGCAKIYLNHSKHILPEAADTEAQMCVKNEYGVEDAAETASRGGVDGDMQPMVVLERLSSPLLRASAAPNTLGASKGKKSTKSYLKRVDQLLKNTMSTLVSIKHEPEVHIDDTGPGPSIDEQAESDVDDTPAGYDDYHATQDDSDEDAASSQPMADAGRVAVKQELIDEAYEQQHVATDSVNIKQEPKPFALKLKITKNHGQLNSSIVDDEDNNEDVVPRGGKKKKKRKHKTAHKERNRETDGVPPTFNCQMEAADNVSSIVHIKQERMDEGYQNVPGPRIGADIEATVMTSIPMAQLDSSYNESAPQVSQAAIREPEDVKPNRLELDRLIQIAHIASGVDMAEEAMPLDNAIEATPDESHATQIPPNDGPTKVKCLKPTARKSTGGATRAQHTDSTSTAKEPAALLLPQIVAVEFGSAVAFDNIPDIVIKPEPCNRGYADEVQQQEEDVAQEINHNDKMDEEAAYIGSLDLNNVSIKQEKNLDICDENVNGNEAEDFHYNGQRNSASGDDDDENDDSASSADEAEENEHTYAEDNEVRIYRELELPPLEPQSEIEEPIPAASALGLVITSVCSQASEASALTAPPEAEKCSSQLGEEATTEVETISAAKDNETQAQPFFETASATNTDEEEQQNVLNHELSAQHVPENAEQDLPLDDSPTDGNELICPTPSTSGCEAAPTAASGSAQNEEETDNRINEQQQEEQMQLGQQLDQNNDDSNINEIAENNNNANIERELQDDANAAQENLNP